MEQALIDLMIEYLGWKNKPIYTYHLLRILRNLKGTACPTYDDYLAGVNR